MKPIQPPLKTVRRILVCQLRQLGDVLLSTAAISLLARRFPSAQVHVLTEKKCVPLLDNNPDVFRVWAVDKHAYAHFGAELAFSFSVAAQGFDLVVDFQQLPRCRWVVAFSRAPIRLTYTPPWYNKLLYTHWIDPLPGYAAMAKASILRPLGIVWAGEKPRLELTHREHADAASALAALGLRPEAPLITVDTTHRRPSRRWPARSWGRLLALAAKALPVPEFLLLYGPGEESDVEQVRQAALAYGCDARRLLVPDRLLGLREMAACIARASLHIGNCSAPRHIAVAVGTPSLVVLGATSASWTYPAPEHRHLALGLPCQPCNRNTCPDPRCLLDLSPEQVLPELLTHYQTFASPSA